MAKRHWYKRYPSDFILGAISLSAEEKGVYSVLLDLLYDRGHPIDNSARDLARICGCSTRRFTIILEKLVTLGKVKISGDKLTNDRFERQHEIEEKEADKLAENGRKGGQTFQDKPAEKKNDLFGNNDLAEKGLNHARILDARLDPSPIGEGRAPPVKPAKAPKVKAAKTLIDETWKPNDKDFAFAASRGFSEARINSMAEAFVNRHLAKAEPSANWSASWRTWVLNQIKFDAERGPGRGPSGRGGNVFFDIAAGRDSDGK